MKKIRANDNRKSCRAWNFFFDYDKVADADRQTGNNENEDAAINDKQIENTDDAALCFCIIDMNRLHECQWIFILWTILWRHIYFLFYNIDKFSYLIKNEKDVVDK